MNKEKILNRAIAIIGALCVTLAVVAGALGIFYEINAQKEEMKGVIVKVDEEYYNNSSLQMAAGHAMSNGDYVGYSSLMGMASSTGDYEYEYVILVEGKEIELTDSKKFELGDSISLVKKTYEDGSVKFLVKADR